MSNHYKEYIQERIQKGDIESILKKNNTRWLKVEDDFAQIFSDTRQGRSLWKFFLIAAIIFLLAETVIGRPEDSLMKKNPQ